MQTDIRQRDLSGKSLEEMSPAERRELKRRFEVFAKARRKAAVRSQVVKGPSGRATGDAREAAPFARERAG